MKKRDIWFERRLIGFVPVDVRGFLLLLFLVIGEALVNGAYDWLHKHKYPDACEEICIAIGIIVFLIFLVLFIRHASLKSSDLL